jgi:hypothetical protein
MAETAHRNQLAGTKLKGHVYNDGTPDQLVVLCYQHVAVYAWSDGDMGGSYSVPASFAREVGDL